MESLDYSQLDPGIRDVVIGLRENGFLTTDSGDGSKFGTMEGALPYPMVVAVCDKQSLFGEADFLRDTLAEIDPLRNWYVEATYYPSDGGCVLLATAPDEFETPECEN